MNGSDNVANRRTGLGPLGGIISKEVAEASDAPRSGEKLTRLPVELLQRGRYQPRKDMGHEALAELADSIRAQGVVQPLVVRPLETRDGYEIIAGERRWRAAQMAGLEAVPAVVRDISDQAAIAIALIENIQREDLNPLEEAEALARLVEEFELTHEKAAEAVGRSRTAVTNLLRLLELTSDVKTLLRQGRIGMGHARALLSLPQRQQGEAARKIVQQNLTAREAEALVRKFKSGSIKSKSRKLDPNVQALERDLAERLGARVAVQTQRGGKGKLVIHYSSLEQLDGILGRIK